MNYVPWTPGGEGRTAGSAWPMPADPSLTPRVEQGVEEAVSLLQALLDEALCLSAYVGAPPESWDEDFAAWVDRCDSAATILASTAGFGGEALWATASATSEEETGLSKVLLLLAALKTERMAPAPAPLL